MFSTKDQTVKILGFVDLTVSVITTQLSCYSMKVPKPIPEPISVTVFHSNFTCRNRRQSSGPQFINLYTGNSAHS